MKLCVVKPDGYIAEIPLNEKQPSFDNVNNELLLFENYRYKLIIRGIDAIDNVELFVGDYSVPLIFNENTGCLESGKELVFGGCFDLAYVSVYIENDEGSEKLLYTDFLRIATTKQTAKQVSQMLNEIEEALPNFLDVCFSRNRKKSGIIKNDVRSIWNTIKILDDIINIYETNYGCFVNHKKTSVEQVATIADIKAMREIGQESLQWIVCNPDNLVQTDKTSGISLNGKSYIPSKIKTYLSQYSYDVYENRMILGFLQTVINYIEDQIVGFSNEIAELENIPESIVIQLPNTHELTGRCVYIYYKGVVEKLIDRKERLVEIYYKYEKTLECRADILYGIPKLTNTFKQVFHYRVCYECMVKWFEAGDYSFDHLDYLFKLKTLSRIFEYFCLIKLQSAIILCGYSIKETNKITYDMEDDTEEINNQYIFTGGNYELTLFYEPSVWVDKINEEMGLYSTGYNFSKGKWNNRWKPDFILKIKGEASEYYYILDAKYSNYQNVKKIYMPELVLKYGTQIASKDKFFSEVVGVCAIYPGENDNIHYYKKNSINSQKMSLPQYFSMTVMGQDSGNVALSARIEKMLENVDYIERDQGCLEKDTSTMPHTFLDGNNVKEIATTVSVTGDGKNQNKFHDEAENYNENMGAVAENNYVTNKGIKVNGKKCFYYGKGMCMCQRSRCIVSEGECEFYISKSGKELFKDEDTCRNFIRYMKKGKVSRVECSISGMPGCVGTDNCRFYLRKNKSKT